MSKRVVVIASGETERQGIPGLLRDLRAEGIEVTTVLKPPRDKPLKADLVKKLILSEWYRNHPEVPDKFVVLLDTDQRSVEETLKPFRDFTAQLQQVKATIFFACARRHLEAWFFADEQGLRRFLGRSVGSVDASSPEEIQNPKLHLSSLLGRPYTSQVAGRIAASLSPAAIRGRSSTFKDFEAAVRNGAR